MFRFKLKIRETVSGRSRDIFFSLGALILPCQFGLLAIIKNISVFRVFEKLPLHLCNLKLYYEHCLQNIIGAKQFLGQEDYLFVPGNNFCVRKITYLCPLNNEMLHSIRQMLSRIVETFIINSDSTAYS